MSREFLAHKKLQSFFRYEIWVNAFKLQVAVVRNVMLSVSFAWVATACFALGNIFSGKAARYQSTEELIVSNFLWFGIWYCGLVLVGHIPAMRSLHFVDTPNQLPPVLFCLKKLFLGSYRQFFLSFLLTFGSGWLVASTDLKKVELAVYFAIVCSAGYNVAIGLAFRRVFFLETQEGRARLDRSRRKSRTRQILPSPSTEKPEHDKPRYRTVYIKALSQPLGLLMIAGYVHVVCWQKLAKQGGSAVAWFMAGSLLLKFLVQEVLKHCVLKTRIRDVRAMAVLVGIPTVLIDTQTRIILLGLQSSQSVVAGTIGMVFVEIATRFIKALWVVKAIRKRRRTMLQWSSPLRPIILERFDAEKASSHRASSTHIHDYSHWVGKCHAYHTAEIHADMFAEYISIGCSTAVYCILGENPHYARLHANGVGRHLSKQLEVFTFQFMVEIFVDFVSIAVEMVAGIDFTRVKGLGAFFAMVFMVIAFLNVTLIVMIYMD